MHQLHNTLFEYAEFLKQTEIEEIKITDGRVVMTSHKGIKIYCDPEDYRIAPIEILNFGDYERIESEMMLNLISEDAFVFDIGANIGWYSINIANDKPRARIFSFEPITKTYNYLRGNIELNRLSNIHPYNIGFSDEKRDAVFYYYPEGSGNASLSNLSQSDNVIEVNCRLETLDSFIKKRDIRVDFIKCDVEGAELIVFKGGIMSLKEFKPIMFVEMLRKFAKAFDYHPNQLISLLNDLGYQCFTICEKGLKKFGKMDEETIQTNFIFLHTEKHQEEIEQWIR
jgi:FkbM family methyltransferase